MNAKPSFFLSRENLLYLLAAAVPIAFTAWMSLLNNFVVEVAHFDGEKIGFLQSLREVSGLLAFTIVFVLLIIRQQNAAYFSLFLLGAGTFVTGFFTSTIGLYITTLIMSTGFHYIETLHSSLSLQWIDKQKTPSFLGKLSALRSIVGLITLGFIYFLMHFLDFGYQSIYILSGGLTLLLAFIAWLGFEHLKMMYLKKQSFFYARNIGYFTY